MPDNVKVVDKAKVPSSPVKPRPLMNIAIAGVLGIMVGLGIIFLIEYLDNTIKTPDDVQKYLGLPVLGSIPNFED
jgi:capsular polysaccharide biosynthesis protein